MIPVIAAAIPIAIRRAAAALHFAHRRLGRAARDVAHFRDIENVNDIAGLQCQVGLCIQDIDRREGNHSSLHGLTIQAQNPAHQQIRQWLSGLRRKHIRRFEQRLQGRCRAQREGTM